MERFGEIIKTRRKVLGLKVYELAQKVGIHSVYMTQIEKHDKIPSPAILKNIAKALYFSQKEFRMVLNLVLIKKIDQAMKKDVYSFYFELLKDTFKRQRKPNIEKRITKHYQEYLSYLKG